jgi:hypothetical protein
MFGATGRALVGTCCSSCSCLVCAPVLAFWNNLLLDYGCQFLNDNMICEMCDARLPVFLPNLNLMNCPNCLIVSA